MNKKDIQNYIDGLVSGMQLIDGDTLNKDEMIARLIVIQNMVQSIADVPKFVPEPPTIPNWHMPIGPYSPSPLDPMYDPNRIIC